ncbi:MAG: class I SAM-dependent methyltransferase [Nocardioides sp.]
MDAAHWDTVYSSNDPRAVSWYEQQPDTSMRLIRSATAGGDVIDVGAGASELADALVESGYGVTVLDVSAEALKLVRARLADRISYVTTDVLAWQPGRTYEVWHDRAVFHFLIDADDQGRYAECAAAAVRPSGMLVIGTFAPDGPEKCSGLTTARHDVDSLARIFGRDFDLAHAERADHTTPWGASQSFTWAVFTRR